MQCCAKNKTRKIKRKGAEERKKEIRMRIKSQKSKTEKIGYFGQGWPLNLKPREEVRKITSGDREVGRKAGNTGLKGLRCGDRNDEGYDDEG